MAYMEQETEYQDSPNLEQTETVATPTSAVDVNALIEQNRKLYARAKQAEGKLKEQTPAAEVINSNPSPAYSINDEVVDLRLDGHSKDEVTFIMQNGGRKALEDPNSYVAIAINTKREQRRAEQAASQTADTSHLSEVERKYTPEQLKAMTVSELEKILPHAD